MADGQDQERGQGQGQGRGGAGASRSPAVKRLMREAAEMAAESGDEAHAAPLEDNLFEWHFTVRGARATDFAGGVYHGRVLLPPEYPMRPPHVVLLTPNGRFEVGKKICLSISGHHPETWRPSWSIRTALLALVAFMPTPGEGTIGSLDYTPVERRRLAARSRSWACPTCGPVERLLRKDEGDAQRAPPPQEQEQTQPSAQPPPPQLPPQNEEMPDDSVRDCVIACLLLAIAIFIYRRLGIVSGADTLQPGY